MSGAAPLRVLLVDDHVLLADSLAVALRAEGVDATLADLDSRETLVQTVRDDPPDLVLLDLELGGALGDGATLVRPFVQAGTRVLLVTASRRKAQIGAAIEQGACGVVSKAAPFDTLLERCLAGARGEPVMTQDDRQRSLQHLYAAREREAEARAPFERLTPREQVVLRELCNGNSVAGIAEEWVVSEATVRTQERGILTKLGASSQLEAVARALHAGWLEDVRRDRRRS